MCVSVDVISRPQVDLAFLRSCVFSLRRAFEQFGQSLRFRSHRSAWTLAYSIHGSRRLNAGLEHEILGQLTFFSNVSIVLEDVDTHMLTLRRRVETQTKRRQSHVNADTVPETKNAGTQGRPVAGFMVVHNFCVFEFPSFRPYTSTTAY